MPKKIIIGTAILILVILGIYFTRAKDTSAPTQNPPPPVTELTPPPAEQPVSCARNVDQAKMSATVTDIKNKFAVMTIQGYGDVKIRLADQDAPQTVANFLKLSGAGFYNCLTFHRILDLDPRPAVFGRMIQGGDPEGTGAGGPGYTVPAEIKLLHTKGAIAMARTGDEVNPTRASSGSQFYITVDELTFLDGQYTVFGYVVEGMDIVEKVSAVKTNTAGLPATPVIIEKVVITNN